MPSVALITCRELPEPDPDQQPLLAALEGAGLQASLLPWDDPDANPGPFNLCVFRSCWNYYRDAPAFAAWLDDAAAVCELINSPPAVRWNLHKGYLRTLETTGLPVVPTVWCTAGKRARLDRILNQQDWHDVVLKPAISAGSYRTRRFARHQGAAAQAFLDSLLDSGDAMIQRTVVPPPGRGERALVWIDGEATHAVAKTPRFAGDVERVGAAQPLTSDEQLLLERALACVPGELLYARLDLFTDEDGQPLISELELIEPSLFLVQQPRALERLVAALARRAAALA